MWQSHTDVISLSSVAGMNRPLSSLEVLQQWFPLRNGMRMSFGLAVHILGWPLGGIEPEEHVIGTLCSHAAMR